MTEYSLHAASAQLDRRLAEADSLKYTDHEGMLAAAQIASDLAQSLGDYYRYAQALTHQAWAYGNLNQYAASLMCSLEVMALARSHGYVDIEARAVGIVSLNFCRCGMSHEAVYLYEHQLQLGKQLNEPQLQAMALNDWALIELGDHKLGVESTCFSGRRNSCLPTRITGLTGAAFTITCRWPISTHSAGTRR